MRNSIQKPSLSKFYVDDGLVENTDPIQLQQDLNTIIDLFSKVGLKANDKKTKYMIVRGAALPRISSIATNDNIENEERSYKLKHCHTLREGRKR